jgi:hypothetical protein
MVLDGRLDGLPTSFVSLCFTILGDILTNEKSGLANISACMRSDFCMQS